MFLGGSSWYFKLIVNFPYYVGDRGYIVFTPEWFVKIVIILVIIFLNPNKLVSKKVDKVDYKLDNTQSAQF